MKIAISFGLGKSADSDGNGLRAVGESLKAQGHTVQYLTCYGDIEGEPDVLIGHSFGGARCIDWLKANPKHTALWLFLIDPVPRGWWIWPFTLIGKWKVPANVKRAMCFYQRNQALPPSRKIQNDDNSFENVDLTSGGYKHANIPEAHEVFWAIDKALRAPV